MKEIKTTTNEPERDEFREGMLFIIQNFRAMNPHLFPEPPSVPMNLTKRKSLRKSHTSKEK